MLSEEQKCRYTTKCRRSGRLRSTRSAAISMKIPSGSFRDLEATRDLTTAMDHPIPTTPNRCLQIRVRRTPGRRTRSRRTRGRSTQKTPMAHRTRHRRPRSDTNIRSTPSTRTGRPSPTRGEKVSVNNFANVSEEEKAACSSSSTSRLNDTPTVRHEVSTDERDREPDGG